MVAFGGGGRHRVIYFRLVFEMKNRLHSRSITEGKT